MILLSKIKHVVAQVTYAVIKTFIPIHKGRVLCDAFGGLQYSCNPKYITESILENYPNDFQIIWSFQKPDKITGLNEKIIKVKKWSLKEFYYIATSEFLISNIRLNDFGWGWKKRKGQKYIMTWHGSMALKRVEFDAADKLSSGYISNAVNDSKNVDLMLSDSEWCNDFMRRAFKYDGEIMDRGLPRNDVFLQPDKIARITDKVREYYGIKNNEKILLYAPTFRVDKSIDNYIFQWEDILLAAEDHWKSKFKIMIRLHPGMIGGVDSSPMMTSKNCIDVTRYSDMQELLCAADVLITDYSSSMFEFALKESPCFLYVPDADSYDRGFYFQLEELPFPVARNILSLPAQIHDFNNNKYRAALQHMFNDTFKTTQNPNSSMCIVEWMVSKKYTKN